MTIAIIICSILFLLVANAICKTYKYSETLEGLARIHYLTTLEKNDLKKEPFSDQLYVWVLNFFSTEQKETPQPEEQEYYPTFQEYKEWQANRPDLKTWREYAEWKTLKEEREIDADDGDAEHGG